MLDKFRHISIQTCVYLYKRHGIKVTGEQSTSLHFTQMTYIKVLEQCSLSDNRNVQERDNTTKVNIGRQSVEGTTVKEIELITKEKKLEQIRHERTKADIQALDDTYQTKEIKESLTIEPVPSKLVHESNTLAAVSIEKTQNTSLEYGQVEAAIKEKEIENTETHFPNNDEEERIKREIESQFPITVSNNDHERVFALDTEVPEKEKIMLIASSRKESASQVSTFLPTKIKFCSLEFEIL